MVFDRVPSGESVRAASAGGLGGAPARSAQVVDREPAGNTTLGGAAAGSRVDWPEWARNQLHSAAATAAAASASASLAALLYREWFTQPIAGVDLRRPRRPRRPLAGVYRSAHAGSTHRRREHDVLTIARHDVIAPNGWWRTWGETWTPPRTRPGSVRVLFSPNPERLAEFVETITATLVGASAPWSLSCATDPRRVRRCGAAVLDLPSLDALPAQLVTDLAPLLAPQASPLCLPLAAGAAAAYYPDNGMTFGEHRCHLVALGLRRAAGVDALGTIAGVFRAHGLDPSSPYRG